MISSLVIRIPNDDEIIQSSKNQFTRSYFRSVYSSFLLNIIKLQKYESVFYIKRRTYERIISSCTFLHRKYEHAIELLKQSDSLPLTISLRLIKVMTDLSILLQKIATKKIYDNDDNIEDIEWSDDESCDNDVVMKLNEEIRYNKEQ